MPTPSARELERVNRRVPSAGEHVTLLMTTAGSVRLVSATGHWVKATSQRGEVPTGSGNWRPASVLAVPSSVTEAVASVVEAVHHPNTRSGIEHVHVGDHLYLWTCGSWTLTTPIVRVLSGALAAEVVDDDEGVFVVAGADAAWLVEAGMLLPFQDGGILLQPMFLAVGDRVDNTLITHAVRLD